jgi:monoamine oxidase
MGSDIGRTRSCLSSTQGSGPSDSVSKPKRLAEPKPERSNAPLQVGSGVAPPLNPNATQLHDVVIVGAGWAGLTAAKELRQGGFEPLVLEARPVAGGRIRTDRSTLSVPFDDGAAWVHSYLDNAGDAVHPVSERMLESRIAHTETDLTSKLYIDGRLATPAELLEYHEALEHQELRLARAAALDVDVAASTVTKASTPIERLAESNLGPLDMGQSLSKMSSKDTGRQVMTGRDALANQDEVLKAMVGEVPVRTDTPVTRIKRLAGGFELTTAQGEVVRAKRLLLTVSTGILASGKIEFDPPLPKWKTDAIGQLPMGVLNKVALEFDGNIFQDGDGNPIPADAWVMQADSAPGAEPMAFLMRPGGADVAVGFVGGDEALKTERLSDALTVKRATDKLQNMFGGDVASRVTGYKVTRWSQDPWTLGSYSYARPGYADAREKLAQPIDNRLFFAGEATALNGEAQMIHGAYASGVRAAREIMHSLASEQRKTSPPRREHTLGFEAT